MKYPLLICALLAVLASLSCGGKELESRWKDREIVIDGQTPEWYGAVTYLRDDKVSVGLMNDEEFLYVSFTASDRETQMQVLARGATLWFDPEGGNDRVFGVRFPLGLIGAGLPVPESDGDRENRPEPHELVTRYQGSGVEMELLHRDDEPIRFRVVESPRIDVAVSDVQGVLVYELKVPIRDLPHGIGSQAGSTIGVRFQTREIDREELREQMEAKGGRPPGGGRGDLGRGPGRGSAGGGMRGPSPQMPAAIDVSTRVVLASPESARTPILNSEGD